MKRMLLLFVCFSVVLFGVGCQNTQSRAVEGGIIGGLLGATAGGIIGHQSGHGGRGAAIGAATGVLAGALVGSQIEKPKAQGQEEAAVSQNANQMSLQQIIDLSNQKVSDDEIINKMRATNSKFNLSAVDAAYLREHGISQKVIDAMH